MLSKYDRAALSFGLESLESRRMLAATIGAGGVLNITGTSGKDSITLNKLSTGKLEVNINGTTSQFTYSATVASGKYTTISILAAGSDDTVVIKDNVSYKGASINGEAGNDKLTGGLGPDNIVGGSGQDQANYSARSDNLLIKLDGQPFDGSTNFSEGDNVQTEEVYTGSGNDKIIGSSGPDGIFSGAGADQVDGKGGNDVINGSSGTDVLVGGADDDSVDAENNDADQVNTGDGIDFLAFDDGLDTAGPNAISLLAQAKGGLGKFGANLAPAPSDLDPDYGDGGKQSGPDFGLDDISAVAVDSEGRVVFVGSAFVGSGYGEGGTEDMFVTRYTADGELDTDFGDEGSTLIDFSVGGEGSYDNAYGVAIGAGDSIVVVGCSQSFFGTEFAVARLTEAGDLDEGFSGDGKRKLSLDTDDDFDAIARDVAIQSDGSIVVAGDRSRVNTEASYDPAFEFSPDNNPGGAWSYAFSPTLADSPTLYDTPTHVDDGRDFWNSSTLPSGATLAPDVQHNGTGYGSGGLADGVLALDPGFFGQYSHVIFTVPTTGNYEVNGEFNGAIVGDGATTDVHVLLNGVSIFDGDIDVPAGAEGSSTAGFNLDHLDLNAGDTVDFVVGYGANRITTDDTTALSALITRISAPDDQTFAVARLTDTGQIDEGFNFGQGFNIIDVGLDQHASSVALQTLEEDSGAQRIVVGGSADGEYVVSRFLADGQVDSGFGDFGGYSSQGFEQGGNLNDIAVDANNNIYAVGDALTEIIDDVDSQNVGFSGGLTAAVLAKFDANGSFVDSVEEDSIASFDSYNGVTVDSSGHVVAVGTDNELYTVGRYDSDLNFDPSFGNGTSPSGIDIISESHDVALGAAVLGSGKILVGGYSFAGGVISMDGGLSVAGSELDAEGFGVLPSVIRLVGDDSTPFDSEKILDSGDLKDPPPELVERLAPLSDSAKIYFLSAPDENGDVEIKTNNSGPDVITITKITAADGTDNWAVTINGITQFYAVSTTHSIKVITDGGADIITADNTVTVDLIVFAGDGGDKITGGAGKNYLFGEAGDDLINGGTNGDALSGGVGKDEVNGNNGNDIVIGGPGLDNCNGGNGEDIIIPGTTTYDGDLAALKALLDEWTSSNPNSLRITNIRSGVNGGLNDPYHFSVTGPDRTVFDDGSKDKLTGGAGRDWFFRGKNGPDPDVLTDGQASEEYDNL